MTLLGYHGFTNWQPKMVEGENEIDTILFGFELECQQDFDNSIENQPNPETVAQRLQREFGDLFVYERDSSIGVGVEVISMPMSMKYYLANIDKFKKLLKMLQEMNYVSTKGNNCGLHIHYGRKGLSFTNKEVENTPTLNTKAIETKRENTIANVISVLNCFKDELTKISGRSNNSLRWCRWETNNDSDIKSIKAIAKAKGKKKSFNHNERYTVVNLLNENTIEVRLNRGTLKWQSFNTRILLMYNVIDISRRYKGIVSFRKVVEWGKNPYKEEMKNYIENNSIENKRVKIDEVNQKINISLDTELRVENLDFLKRR